MVKILNMSDLITLNNIQLQYQNGSVVTEVIKGITLAVKKQETLAIIGKVDLVRLLLLCYLQV